MGYSHSFKDYYSSTYAPTFVWAPKTTLINEDSFNEDNDGVDNDGKIEDSIVAGRDVRDSGNQDNDVNIRDSFNEDNDITVIRDSFNQDNDQDNDTVNIRDSFNQDNDVLDIDIDDSFNVIDNDLIDIF